MNEAKPIVTCHGNQVLFSGLHGAVVHGLPKEPCEWRRSYGRAPRSVYLEASFVPYDADILPDEEEKTLVSRPYFHIFWTDCDLDSYKQTVKDEISEWYAALKARSIPDWLIVVVTGDESKVKAKLLPRASVTDKVKGDFCGKYPERCIVLTDPNKLDSRSSESWSQLFHRLRTLLLQSFNRHLNKYEETMRSKREKRNEPGWNYFSYFIFQEELAFMFEMLGLKEDALIQYDELDAMFDQFVENFASGDVVKWLTPLIEPCTSWPGVSLAKSLDLDLRDEIKQNNASLLGFRNYLFSRQAALLFQMQRAWEVAMRAMDYLYNTVIEMKALEIETPDGALSCWVFLSCLEVLQVCKLHNTQELDEKFALYTANLWDFARKKLQELGHLCSLMPGLVPSSAQLSLVVDLVSGMGLSAQTLTPDNQKPVDKLRESLSSPDSFKKHYLDMCEQAMGTYKYIGRFRSSRLIGMELADFYMKINEAAQAENFLLDSIRMYQQEGWSRLADGTMLQLAQCQRVLNAPNKYLKTACHIACSPYISDSERQKYFEETMKSLEQVSDDTIEMRASQVISVESLFLERQSVSLNDELNLTAVVCSNFPQTITLDVIQIAIKKCNEDEALDFVEQQQQQQYLQLSHHDQRKRLAHRRQPSGTHISLDKFANFQPVSKTLPAVLDCYATSEKAKGRLVSSRIACDNAHELLTRTDSNTPIDTTLLYKGDYSMCFTLKDVTLQPGRNTLQSTTTVAEKGIFRLRQMCFTLKSLDLLKPLTNEAVYFKVQSISPDFTLKPKNTDKFILGIEQEATLRFSSGSYTLKDASPISVTTFPFFGMSPSAGSGSRELVLQALEPNSSQDIPVSLYMGLKDDMEQSLTSKVSISVEGWQQTFHKDIEFVHPFHVSHKIFTAGKQKYVQIVVHGTSGASFNLTEPRLDSPACRDVSLTLLNSPEQNLPVNQHQNVSLLWQLNSNIPVLPALDLTFSCSYNSPLDVNPQPHTFSYSCSIHDFQTQYSVSYGVSSIEEDKSCSIGETAILEIKIKQLTDHDLNEGVKLAYSVKANGNIWAIGGKSIGVFTMKEGKHNICLDVVPMQAGFLYFPLVTLYKTVDQNEDNFAADGENEISDDSDEDDSSPLNTSSHSTSSSPRQLKTRTGSQSSTLSSSQAALRLVEFSPGQVYNESRSKQIHVNPCKANGDIDISLVK